MNSCQLIERSKWALKTTFCLSSGCRRCERSAAMRCAFSRSARKAVTSTRARCCSWPARRRTAATSSRKDRSGSKASRRRGEIIAGPGTLLGELALIAEIKRPATATANEPSTVIRISRSLFLKMLEGYPARGACAARSDRVAGAAGAEGNVATCARVLDTSQTPPQ